MQFSRRGLLCAAGGLALAESCPSIATSSASRAVTRGGGSTPTTFFTGGAFPGKPLPIFPRYLLSLVNRSIPTICWIGAAGGDDEEDFQAFRKAFDRESCKIEHFNVFRPQTDRFDEYFAGFDAVYIDGGSTRNLIALLREWRIDKALKKAWLSGVVMSGASAGALCWFDAGLSDSYPKVLSPVRGLGFLKGSCDVHHHSRPDRAERFRALIASGALPSPGLALDEEVAALYRGDRLTELVSSNRAAGAWMLRKKGGSVVEEPLPIHYL